MFNILPMEFVKFNHEVDQGGLGSPQEGAKLHQKVQKWVLEGAEIKDF